MCLMGKSYSKACSRFLIEVCQNSSLQDNISMATWQNGSFSDQFSVTWLCGRGKSDHKEKSKLSEIRNRGACFVCSKALPSNCLWPRKMLWSDFTADGTVLPPGRGRGKAELRSQEGWQGAESAALQSKHVHTYVAIFLSILACISRPQQIQLILYHLINAHQQWALCSYCGWGIHTSMLRKKNKSKVCIFCWIWNTERTFNNGGQGLTSMLSFLKSQPCRKLKCYQAELAWGC